MTAENYTDVTHRRSQLSATKRALLEQRLRGGKVTTQTTEISRCPDRNFAPLSFAQQRLWFIDQLTPGNSAYNVPVALNIKGNLNIAVLERVLNEIIKRHESLRTNFRAVNDRPVQVIASTMPLILPTIDLRNLPESIRKTEAAQLISKETRQSFNLSSQLLLRACLLFLAQSEYLLLLTMHHIISDGWSMGILTREVVSLYEAFSMNSISPLPELPIQYIDFVYWQHERMKSRELEHQLEYWKNKLSGELPALNLSLCRSRPKVQSFRGASQILQLSLELSEALKALSQRENATLFMTLLAAFQALLYRYTQQEEIIIGTPIANRNRAEIENLIGFFVNTLVLFGNLKGNPRFVELLTRVRETTLEAYTHQDLPFERLVEELQPIRDLSRNPLFQVMFTLQNAPKSQLSLPGLTITPYKFDAGATRFDLEFHLSEQPYGIEALLVYNTDLFDDVTAIQLLQHFQTLLYEIVTRPDKRIANYQLLSEDEHKKILTELNCREFISIQEKPFHELFQEQVELYPTAIAVVYGTEQLTYYELNRCANQLAYYLQKLGVKPDTRVCVYLDRSLDMVISLLAVAKAGGAYIPIDINYPVERVDFILKDAKPLALLTYENLAKHLSKSNVVLVLIDKERDLITLEKDGNFPSKITPDNLAYVIYTSGSTGEPKGVEIPHLGVMNLIGWHQRTYEILPEDRTAQVANTAFDAAVWELWPYLASGASIYILDEEIKLSPTRMIEWFKENAITITFLPTPLAEAVLEKEWPKDTVLRALLTGGDRLHCKSNQSQPYRLANNYGPTENSVVTTWCWIDEFDSEVLPPIGKPINNVQVYIVDCNLELMPIGVAGEICIAGASLARGYLNQPSLTAESFVPDPFSENPGQRLYKTGDIGRYLANGQIEFLGRKDEQVKVRGYRIELGEIESVLNNHPLLQDAVVIARESQGGEKQLIAYIVPQDSHAIPQYERERLKDEQVNQWQALYNFNYSQSNRISDTTFNITGWNSSYTKAPLLEDEMCEWRDATIERILSLKPKRILEIGCGTGLLLFRLISECEYYYGSDFSQVSLDYVQRQLEYNRHDQSCVTLMQRSADDFSDIGPGSFDTVILNSIVQYFPDLDYFLKVLTGAIKSLRSGGYIFIGDLRDFRLLQAFHISVQLFQSPDDLDTQILLKRAQQRISQEGELLIDPTLFRVLKAQFPEIDQVRVLLKHGKYQNELTCFRYDVIVHVGTSPCPADRQTSCTWLDWQAQGLTISDIKSVLLKESPLRLGIRRVINGRVEKDLLAMSLLNANRGCQTVGELRKAIESHTNIGIDPEEFWLLSDELDYDVDISCLWEEGCFDVLFCKRGVNGHNNISDLKTNFDNTYNLIQYSNDPLHVMLIKQLPTYLYDFLLEKLPQYMLPSSFVTLEHLPLTANGKVDKQALLIFKDYNSELDNNYIAPQTIIEQKLIAIWADLLGVMRIGANDNFFALGGHSLLATQMISRLRTVFSIELPLQTAFQAATITQLAAIIEAVIDNSEKYNDIITPVTRDQDLPLSFAQQRLWFLNQLEEGGAAYNITDSLLIEGSLDIKALEKSINEIIKRHEVLRTVFQTRQGEPIQIILPSQPFTLTNIDLSAIAEQQQIARQIASELGECVFDLTQGPLLRGCLMCMNKEEYVLVVTLHHIVADGWSLGILIRELTGYYEAELRGEKVEMQPLTVQYADYALWQREWLRGEVLEQQLEYWREQLAGVSPLLELPYDRPRPVIQSFHGASVSIKVTSELTHRIKTLSQREGTTLFMTLLAAFQALLYRYTQQEEIIIGTPIANRNRAEIENLIGFFVNTLVLFGNLKGNPRFVELLTRVRETTLEAYTHQDLPFERLVEELQPIRDLSRNPLFQVMFTLQNAPKSQLSLPGLTITPYKFDAGATRFDLEFHLSEQPYGIEALLVYNTDLFDDVTAIQLLQHFQTLLYEIVTRPDKRIANYQLLSEDEHKKILTELNCREFISIQEKPFHELFQEQVELYPTAIAVVYGTEQLTYYELNRCANQLAYYLQKLGVKPDTRVCVYLDRSLDMVISLLAVAKAGGAYIPIDINYPVERVDFILKDAKPLALLTYENLAKHLSKSNVVLVLIDKERDLITLEKDGNFPSKITPDNLAYVIYTSGSTGEPKGVEIPHLGVMNLIGWHQRTYEILPEDRTAQVANTAFDAAVWELWPYLASGASIYILDEEIKLSPTRMIEWFKENAITITFLPTPLAEAVLEKEWPKDTVLRALLTGGDRLHCKSNQSQPYRLANNYGPTENSVVTTWCWIDEFDSEVLPPIGKPINNVQVYIVDCNLELMPIGVAGEICIAGASLARGYLNQPSLTAESFVPDPFSENPGQRLYKTGDIGRYLANGQIEFLGRKDEQVKVRGYRIELGEIESVLNNHPLLQDAVVIARESQGGEKQLIAYIVPQDSHAIPQYERERLKDEQVNQWQALYNFNYSQSNRISDTTFNITGWNSSYTKAPLLEDEMCEWRDATIERILSLKPKRILEIGCGTGLLLFRLISECEYYYGSDFSQVSLDYVQRQLEYNRHDQSCVTLMQRSADDFSDIGPGSFDTVILNSIVQYFPDLDYFLKVLTGAIKSLRSGGYIFIGDLRDFRLLQAFHISVQLFQSPDDLDTQILLKRAQQRISQEGELLIDPTLFRVLKAQFPEIDQVRVLLKHGKYQNELTCFRYDVIVHVGTSPCPADRQTSCTWLDWQAQGLTISDIKSVLLKESPLRLGIRRVINGRVEKDLLAMSLLNANRGCQTVGELRKAIESHTNIGIDPEEFWLLSDELDYDVDISCLWEEGCFDVLFCKRGVNGHNNISDLKTNFDNTYNLIQYSNDPLHVMLIKQLPTYLYDFLLEKLPQYMLPSSFVTLEHLPLTANGKVDKQALLIFKDYNSELDNNYIAPQTIIEQKLIAIWADLLGVMRIGANDNFFALGGHSLLATQMISRLRTVFSIELPLQTAFQAATITQLAAIIEAVIDNSEKYNDIITPVTRDQDLPLSFAQQRLWFLNQLEEGGAAYNITDSLLIEGSLDIKALEKSINEIIKRHEVLRTVFQTRQGEPIQIILPSQPFTLTNIDLSAIAEQQQIARQIASELGECVFDLTQGPLLRGCLMCMNKEEYVLVVTLHHIVADGWSLGILIRELTGYYEAELRGEKVEMQPLTVQYADYALWQREWLRGEVLEQQLEYWREQLAGVSPLLELPYDRPRPVIQSFHGARLAFSLDKDFSNSIKALCRSEKTTLYMLLLAAFQALLHRYTGKDDICVGSPIANRRSVELDNLIGFFVNTIVMRGDLSGDPSFRELLSRTRKVALGAYTHQDLPFERLVEDIQPIRALSHSTLFQVMFVLQNTPMSALHLGELTIRPAEADIDISRFEITLSIVEKDECLNGTIEYQTALFESDTIALMIERLQRLLKSIIANPNCNISQLSILTDAEKQHLLLEFNPTTTEYPQHLCIYDLFKQQVKHTPSTIAVQCGEQCLTYLELDACANRLARYLQKLGAIPEMRIGLCVERSLEMIIGILGILKTGASYVPLDPSYPNDRLDLIVKDAGCLLVITKTQHIDRLTRPDLRVICLDTDKFDIDEESVEEVVSRAIPQNLAYLIYTSGSTGKPKGVQVTHQNLVHSTLARFVYYRESVHAFLLLSSFAFDSSVAGIFWTLCQGGTLIIPAEGVHFNLGELERLIEHHNISHMLCLPSLYSLLLSEDKLHKAKSLKTIIVAGESCPLELVNRHYQCLPNTVLFNEYGPTECSVWSSVYQCSMQTAVLGRVPIGVPIANTRIYILNKHLQPVGIGLPGELCVGGTGITRGYLDQADITAEKFIPDSFSGELGARLYKTGDRARLLNNGNIEFLGRIDYQVKVRGYRIEPSEIEIILTNHPSVRDCVVVAYEEKTGNIRLVAYLVTKNQPATSNELINFLKEKVPEFMVPSAFLWLDAIPLTPNGKIDRQVLPMSKLCLDDREDYVTARNQLEAVLVDIWCDVLAVERVSVQDDFFQIGGHSLLATQLISRVRDRFQIDLPLSKLFESPTVEKLAAVLVTSGIDIEWLTPLTDPNIQEIEANVKHYPALFEAISIARGEIAVGAIANSTITHNALVELQPQGSRPPFFCVHPGSGSVGCYYHLARYLGNEQPFYGLQASGLDTKTMPLESVEEMAAYYLTALHLVQKHGPYFLGGWSSGGIIAFEMAQQLYRQGQSVALLALIDTVLPVGDETIDDAAILKELFVDRLDLSLEYLRRLSSDERIEYVSEQLKLNKLVPITFGLPWLRSYFAVYSSIYRATLKYQAQFYPGKLTLLRASEENAYFSSQLDLGWYKLSASVEIKMVAGNHGNMVNEPEVVSLAEQLKNCIDVAL
ncbi:MAG: amino acid adenylation domain-containing protein [Acidobacteriota bacterium]